MSFGAFEVTNHIETPSLIATSTGSSQSSPHSTVLETASPKSPSANPRVNVTVTETEVKPTPSKSGNYKFINSSKPHDLKAQEHRKVVRSQAARLLPLEDDDDDDKDEGTTKAKKRRRQTRPTRNVTFRIDLRVSTAYARAVKRSEEATPVMERLSRAQTPNVRLSPEAGWPAPFAQLPSKSHAFTPGLMHHCEFCSFSNDGCFTTDRQHRQTSPSWPSTYRNSTSFSRAFCAPVGFPWRSPSLPASRSSC